MKPTRDEMNQKERCKRSELLLRFGVFFAGAVLSEGIWGIAEPILDHHSGFLISIIRGTSAILVGGIFLYLAEKTIGIEIVEFFIYKHSRDLNLRKILRSFLEEHRQIKDDGWAKLSLSLILFGSQGDEVEIEGSFDDYILLISAAVIPAQKECFVTYRIGLDRWEEVKSKHNDYFEVLGATRIRKQRVLLATEEEINGLTYDSPIVNDSLDFGVTLYCIPSDQISYIPSDYAFFDRKIVIIGQPIPNSKPGMILDLFVDPYINKGIGSRWSIRVLRGAKIRDFAAERSKLLSLKNNHRCKKFTRSGRDEYRTTRGGLRNEEQEPAVN